MFKLLQHEEPSAQQTNSLIGKTEPVDEVLLVGLPRGQNTRVPGDQTGFPREGELRGAEFNKHFIRMHKTLNRGSHQRGCKGGQRGGGHRGGIIEECNTQEKRGVPTPKQLKRTTKNPTGMPEGGRG